MKLNNGTLSMTGARQIIDNPTSHAGVVFFIWQMEFYET